MRQGLATCLYEALKGGARLSIDDLVERVYAGRDKVPTQAEATLRGQFSKVNFDNRFDGRFLCESGLWRFVKNTERCIATERLAAARLPEPWPDYLFKQPRPTPIPARQDRFYGNSRPRYGR